MNAGGANLWIGFNAAYADEEEVQNAAFPDGDGTLKGFFQKVVALDAGQRIYDAIWDNFSGRIRLLLHNKYVFTPFWKHHNGVERFEDWEDWFRASQRRFRRALEERHTVRVLSLAFDRLYVLRNQIIHSGATEQLGQPGAGTRRRRAPGLSHAWVRRRHDGQPARRPAASPLSGRGLGFRCGGQAPDADCRSCSTPSSPACYAPRLCMLARVSDMALPPVNAAGWPGSRLPRR